MADISKQLQDILVAKYGEDVRGSIHDAIELINLVGEKTLSVGTAITSASSSTLGYYEDSLYLNISTDDLWRCTGSTWELMGNFKGSQGLKGADGVSVLGLVDNKDGTFSVRLSNGATSNPIPLIKGDTGDKGEKGDKGDKGRDLVSIRISSKVGLANTLMAYYSDGTSSIIGTVMDGESGSGTGDMLKSEYASEASGIVNWAKGLSDGENFMPYEVVSNKADKSDSLGGYGITDAYTSSEVNNLLATKATASDSLDGYGIKDAYTKTEVDDVVDGKFNEQIDSGFLQSKNLVVGIFKNCAIQSNGVLQTSSAILYDTAIAKVESGKTYTIKTDDIGFVGGYFTEYPIPNVSSTYNNTRIVQSGEYTFTVPSGVKYVAFRANTNYNQMQCELGNQSTDYVPYSGKSNRELSEEVVTLSRFEYSGDLPYGISYYRMGNLVQLIMANQPRNIAKNSLILSGLPQPYKELILKSYLTADGKLPTFQLKPNGELRTDDIGVSNVWCEASITYICK